MAKLFEIALFAVLLIQWISAAPNEEKLEDIAAVVNNGEQPENQPQTLLEETEPAQGQRQKRWYNYFGFGIPPINPSVYKRDDGQNSGVYGTDNPIVQIHRRLQDISGFIRSPIPQPPPPPLPQFPPLFPVIYIPQVGCGCNPSNTPTRREETPVPPQNNNNNDNNNNGYNNNDNNDPSQTPDIQNRWPIMDDERQNWGIVVNGTNNPGTNNPGSNNPAPGPAVDDNDGARPISFEPIKPIRPLNRPPPPIEHGSFQGDINDLTTTTLVPRIPQQPTTLRPEAPQDPRVPFDVNLQPPSSCDRAVLSCCLSLTSTDFGCFAAQGCPDPSAYGNPCDNGVVLRVIDRFQKYLNQRNG